jgi:hypothetical protein
MTFITVKDLKQTRQLWQQLHAERELVVTRDGRPCAILVEVDSATCEESLAEIRRALFAAAVSRVRRKAAARPLAPTAVDKAIAESRRARGRR